jgi:hypothetical protein
MVARFGFSAESLIAGPTGQIAPEGIDHVFVHKQDFMAVHIRHIYGGVNAIQHGEERLVGSAQLRFRLLAVGDIKPLPHVYVR